MVEQRSPKPLVACSNRVSPAKTSQQKLGRFCFISGFAHARLRVTLARSLFRRFAPYVSRTPLAKTSWFIQGVFVLLKFDHARLRVTLARSLFRRFAPYASRTPLAKTHLDFNFANYVFQNLKYYRKTRRLSFYLKFRFLSIKF